MVLWSPWIPLLVRAQFPWWYIAALAFPLVGLALGASSASGWQLALGSRGGRVRRQKPQLGCRNPQVDRRNLKSAEGVS